MNKDDTLMPSTIDQLTKKFCKGAVQQKEKLAAKLLADGHTSDTASIVERTWYDDSTYTMHFECWAVLK